MAAPITLPMQKRDKSNKSSVEQVKLEAHEIGIIVMDMWDSHWDRTYQGRSGAIARCPLLARLPSGLRMTRPRTISNATSVSGSSPACTRLDWIEVYGTPVKR